MYFCAVKCLVWKKHQTCQHSFGLCLFIDMLNIWSYAMNGILELNELFETLLHDSMNIKINSGTIV